MMLVVSYGGRSLGSSAGNTSVNSVSNGKKATGGSSVIGAGAEEATNAHTMSASLICFSKPYFGRVNNVFAPGESAGVALVSARKLGSGCSLDGSSVIVRLSN